MEVQWRRAVDNSHTDRSWLREKEEKEMSKTIIEIRDFLNNANNDMTLGQFAADWIEDTVDRAETILDSEEITTDDETFCGAVSYNVGTILEVIRHDIPCWKFFNEVERFTARSPAIIMDYRSA